MMKKLLLLSFIMFAWVLKAQQNPHYTQYMYNMSVVNPAYMIDDLGFVEVGLLYRTQWVGIDGAPKTANVFSNIPLSDKIEIGVNYLNDRIGDKVSINENTFNIDFAYKLKLNEKLNLGLGLKVGVDNFNVDFSESNTATDPFLANNKKTVLNFGAGAYLFAENYYIGLSTPNLVPGKLDSNVGTFYQNELHVFLIGGYVFHMNDFKLKPSAVVKAVTGSPLTFDVGINALYLNRFELGAAYRYDDAITGMAGFYITSDLRVGYAYDYNTSDLNDYNSGSHEFILTYRFDVMGLSKKYSSPRFY